MFSFRFRRYILQGASLILCLVEVSAAVVVKNLVLPHGASSKEKAILTIHLRSSEPDILAFSRNSHRPPGWKYILQEERKRWSPAATVARRRRPVTQPVAGPVPAAAGALRQEPEPGLG
jgi:hypothetical protein